MADIQTPGPRNRPQRAEPRTFAVADRARAALPSPEQMRHLIERAERNVLTPAEAHLFRAGVTHLQSQLEQAGGRIVQLRVELVRALAERDEARAQVASSSPLVVECPFCGEPAGSRCRAMRGVQAPPTPHVARIEAAKRFLFAQALGEAS